MFSLSFSYISVSNTELSSQNNIFSTSFVSATSTGATISVDGILDASKRVKEYKESNAALPNYVTIDGVDYNMPSFLYLISKVISNANSGNYQSVTSLTSLSEAGNPFGDSINADIYKNEYVDMANRLANYISTNNQAPNYVQSSKGKVEYKTAVYAFARIGNWMNSNAKSLPNYVTIGSSSTTYQALASSLTNGKNSERDKAGAIFYWIRDNIDYEYYYNSKYYAQGTLDHGAGNCVDQSRLFIAMVRSVGLSAQYHNSECHFTRSDTWIGHVYPQVYFEGSWHWVDTISYLNTLDSINNWDTWRNYNYIYDEISF
jgi:hypothetical protein